MREISQYVALAVAIVALVLALALGRQPTEVRVVLETPHQWQAVQCDPRYNPSFVCD
jgi:hypothetical protein